MRTSEELFELDFFTDHPLFEGFALETTPSLIGRDDLEEDITPGFEVQEDSSRWKPVFLKSIWKTPKVLGRVTSFNDFPGVNMVFPAFSQRACEVLRDFLEPNGELLPIDSDFGQYYIYNITKIVDALDGTNSMWESWCEPLTSAIDIDYFAFHEEKLIGQSIFRVFEIPMTTIVTSQFVKRVYESGLNGFKFKKIWPFQPGEDWRTYNKEKTQNIEVKHFKKNSFVIILMLKGDKPNAKENKQIKSIENELDAQLMIPTINAPYFGRYEGHDIVNGEYRMFLSCPDAIVLKQKLLYWLKELKWAGSVYAMKRYGEIHDVQAKEEVIDLNR